MLIARPRLHRMQRGKNVQRLFYLRRGGYALPSVYTACLLATSRKTTYRIFMKILPKMYWRHS